MFRDCLKNKALKKRARMFGPAALVFGAVLFGIGGCPAGNEITQVAEPQNPAAQEEAVLGEKIGILMAPNQGPITGGTIVTIQSLNGGFNEQTSILFGPYSAIEIKVYNEHVLTAVTPPGDPGTVTVSINVPGLVAYPNQRINLPKFQYYILPPDDGTDTDGDGLTDYQELTGWEIWIEAFGLGLGADTFGNVLRYTCISDPTKEDTDGDGLTDLEEFQNKCDAAKSDTDGDGLHDFEEVMRWHTSPTNVDSDGDARGSGDTKVAPNSKLFDGAELNTIGFEPPPSELFFSEYVEGSGTRKALEIYNPSDAAIDLAAGQYSVTIINEGFTVVPLTGQVAAKSTYVIVNTGAGLPGNFTANLPFDGNDIVLLKKGAGAGIVVDSIGSSLVLDDQRSLGWTDPYSNFQQTRWQSFTAGQSGDLVSIQMSFQSVPNGWYQHTINVRAGEGLQGPVLGTLSAIVPYGNNAIPFTAAAPIPVIAGQVYTIESPASLYPGFSWLGGSVAHYAGGRADADGDIDYEFITRVHPGPWGDANINTRDRTLRRKAAVSKGDTDFGDAFDPMKEWRGFPLDTVSGLGAHRHSVVPVRIVAGGTSPSLADTDGDGVSDYDELNNPLRSPVVADVPKLALEVVDQVDIRLNTEYAEEEGVVHERSYSLTSETTSTEGDETSQAYGGEITAGLEYGTTANSAHVVGSVSSTFSTEAVFVTTHENSVSVQEQFASSEAQSLTKTRAASSGSLSLGVRIRNMGNLGFQLKNLAYSARLWSPKYDPADLTVVGEFKTMATLSLNEALADGVTLGPKEATGVLQVEATDVNVDRIREFLARPRAMLLEPVYHDLYAEDGTNYAFIRENIFARTAHVEIDFGAGRMEDYRVATNVDRGPNGEYVGVSVAAILDQLGIEYDIQPAGPGGSAAFVRVRDAANGTGAFWAVLLHRGDLLYPPGALDLTTLHVQAADELILSYTVDADQDGLLAREEQFYGTSDTAADTDADGISDVREARHWVDVNQTIQPSGWMVNVVGQAPYRVFSDPANADADGDSLNDSQERTLGTDPYKRDTDGDGLSDNLDPAPLQPAIKLYVNASRPADGDGTSWSTAFKSLTSALANAQSRNTDGGAANDVSEIWVARGSYSPPNGQWFQLVNNVSVYGGFAGNELTRDARNPDALTNGCVLEGNNYNNPTIVVAENCGPGTTLAGFTVAGGLTLNNHYWSGAGLNIANASAHFENLIVVGNSCQNNNITAAAGGCVVIGRYGDGSSATFTDCVFSGNLAHVDIGKPVSAGIAVHSSNPHFVRCIWLDNALGNGNSGGALRVFAGSNCRLDACRFEGNQLQAATGQAGGSGAGILIVDGSIFAQNCEFIRNGRLRWSPNDQLRTTGAGGAISMEADSSRLVAVNCTFYNNSALDRGSAICVNNGIATITNCTFSSNMTGDSYYAQQTGGDPTGGAVWCRYELPQSALVYVQNSILINNSRYALASAGYVMDERAQVGSSGINENRFQVTTSLVQNINLCTRYGNWNYYTNGGATPPRVFANNFGNLRLAEDTPFLDFGNAYVDIDRATLALDPMPAIDADGNARVTDGNGDGVLGIDLGAYEVQAASTFQN